MKYRIAYCIPGLYLAGGMERVITLKANYLNEHFDYDIYIILTEGEDKEPFYQLSPGIKIINLGINFDRLYGNIFWKRVCLYLYKQLIYKKRLADCLMEIRPDLTISTLRREVNFINSIKDGSIKIGEIHLSRANYRDFNQELLPGFIKKILRKLWMNQLFSKINRLDKFVVLSHEDKGYWKEIANNKIEVIHNPSSFNPTQASTCQNKKVIAVGRYTYQKGFDLLINAWQIVNREHPEWELHIYGEGNRSSFHDMVHELHLQKTCFLHPATVQIEEKYIESSIFAFSSRYEGFGMVLVEAMSCGIPLVSFDCPSGPKDIILDGENGFLVENGNISLFADKLIYLIENDFIRKEMGVKALSHATRFSMEHIAQQWNTLFEQLLTIDKSK